MYHFNISCQYRNYFKYDKIKNAPTEVSAQKRKFRLSPNKLKCRNGVFAHHHIWNLHFIKSYYGNARKRVFSRKKRKYTQSLCTYSVCLAISVYHIFLHKSTIFFKKTKKGQKKAPSGRELSRSETTRLKESALLEFSQAPSVTEINLRATSLSEGGFSLPRSAGDVAPAGATEGYRPTVRYTPSSVSLRSTPSPEGGKAKNARRRIFVFAVDDAAEKTADSFESAVLRLFSISAIFCAVYRRVAEYHVMTTAFIFTALAKPSGFI